MKHDLIKIYNRDLDRLKNEISAFAEEENLWKTSGKIKNPAGNLCLHLIGNINTYIGKNLGQTGYVRNRELEFSQKNVPRQLLIEQITSTKLVVEKVLEKLDNAELAKPYPENVLGHDMSVQFFLVHLIAHLSYHLGQISYLRRVLE